MSAPTFAQCGWAVESPEATLPYQQLNEHGSTTILFIHGAFASGSEWDLVAPRFPDRYHLLLPDLPGHGNAANILPFSKQFSARLLADLIKRTAKGGKAHVVGCSLGPTVAVELVSTYPACVMDVFLSGFGVFKSGGGLYGYMPNLMWLNTRFENSIPRSVTSWLMDGADIRRADLELATVDLCRSIIEAQIDYLAVPQPWPARTMIVAATKAGIAPSNDSLEAASTMLAIAERGNSASTGFMHPLMRHPWNRQDPNLFTRTVVAWFEAKLIPDGFTKLT